jgi:serine/threonine-protein kinase RsbW
MTMTKNNKNIENILLNISITAEFTNLDSVRSEIYSCASKFGFNDDTAHLISLSVDEACTNLIRYAYSFNNKKKIEIKVEKSDSDFVVIIEDNGTPFNPLEVTSPDMNKYFEEFRRGGLGIYIIKKAMDLIQYTPAESKSKKNHLKLVKKLV